MPTLHRSHTQRSFLRFALAGTAAAAAWSLGRQRPLLRLSLAALGGYQLARGLGMGRRSPTIEAFETAPENSHFAVVDGITMRWEQHGGSAPDAVPVIFVHGIPTHPRLWRYIIPKVAGPNVHCLAWELVGFGWSMEAGLDRDISVSSQARYLRAWLRHMGIQRAVFVGHDLGGGVIQRLLAEEPELAAGLVLGDCIAYDNWPVAAVRLARKMTGIIERLPPPLFKAVFLTGLYNLGHSSTQRRKDSASLHWQPYNRALGPRAFVHQIRNLNARDTLEISHSLSRINTPAHVLWGEFDPLGMPSGQQLAADLRAPLHRIPGGRHFSPEDHPNLFIAAVQHVLSETKLNQPFAQTGFHIDPPGANEATAEHQTTVPVRHSGPAQHIETGGRH